MIHPSYVESQEQILRALARVSSGREVNESNNGRTALAVKQQPKVFCTSLITHLNTHGILSKLLVRFMALELHVG